MIVLAWVIMAGLIAFMGILLATALANAWWRMPFVPTPMPVVSKMVEMACCKDGDVIYDLGAGDGRLLLLAKKRVPGIRAIGYEVAIGAWLLAQWHRLLSRADVDIRMQNFMNKPLSDADVVFVYLSPSFMKMLLPKFKAELKRGARVVSHAFKLPDREPTSIARLEAPLWGRQTVYVYEW